MITQKPMFSSEEIIIRIGSVSRCHTVLGYDPSIFLSSLKSFNQPPITNESQQTESVYEREFVIFFEKGRLGNERIWKNNVRLSNCCWSILSKHLSTPLLCFIFKVNEKSIVVGTTQQFDDYKIV